jgi:thymidylate kinase
VSDYLDTRTARKVLYDIGIAYINNVMDNRINTTDQDILTKIFSAEEISLGSAQYTINTKALVISPNGPLPDIKGLNLVIDPYKMNNTLRGFETRDFSFINNSDGSIRWIFPTDLNRPGFLNFYNSANTKAIIFSKVLKVIFHLGLSRFFRSGSFRVHSRYGKGLLFWISKQAYSQFSIFTGTVGPNRKAIIELSQMGRTRAFIKYALSKQSEELIQNEISTLRWLKTCKLHTIQIPELITSHKHQAVLENIKPEGITSSAKFSEVHFKALFELFTSSMHTNTVKETDYWNQIETQIQQITNDDAVPYSKNILKNLKRLSGLIQTDAKVILSRSHGDFTPWNMYPQGERLFLYDWELSQAAVPVFHDLFHYIFQSEILLFHSDFLKIQASIDGIIEKPYSQRLIEFYHIDIGLNYSLYLLNNISYYLLIYQKQDHLHMQVSWLLKAWNDALLFQVKNHQQTLNSRQNFIRDLFTLLSSKKYTLLKHLEENIENLSTASDIDLLIPKYEIDSVVKFARSHPLAKRAKLRQKSYMSTLEIYLNGGEFLSIDLVTRFLRKTLQYMDAELVLESRLKTQKGLFIPDPRHNFEYIYLFYTLNRSEIPEKYINWLITLPQNTQSLLTRDLSANYHLQGLQVEDLRVFQKDRFIQTKRILKKKLPEPVKSKIRRFFTYISDTINDMRQNPGFIITVSGVDGAGKSTIIEELKEEITTKYRKKVKILRHRPSLLPIISSYKYGRQEAEKRAVESLPRTGMNSSGVSSLLRFLYYYSDYLFGQIYVYFKYVLRGFIVIYDRYYFDFIQDAKRSNISLNTSLAKSLFRFIIKPRLNIFLYAHSDEILKRKKELNARTITSLTSNYRKMFRGYSQKFSKSKYVSIENLNKNKTVQKIMTEYLRIV